MELTILCFADNTEHVLSSSNEAFKREEILLSSTVVLSDILKKLVETIFHHVADPTNVQLTCCR